MSNPTHPQKPEGSLPEEIGIRWSGYSWLISASDKADAFFVPEASLEKLRAERDEALKEVERLKEKYDALMAASKTMKADEKYWINEMAEFSAKAQAREDALKAEVEARKEHEVKYTEALDTCRRKGQETRDELSRVKKVAMDALEGSKKTLALYDKECFWDNAKYQIAEIDKALALLGEPSEGGGK
jgi:chromosome segregation ATPase